MLTLLVDPWNRLQTLKDSLSEQELQSMNNVQAVIDEFWDSRSLSGRLDEALVRLSQSEVYKEFGEE